jgi:hypothetical protein
MSADVSTNPATRVSDAPRGLPLEAQLRIGVQTIHRRSEPASESWLPTIEDMRTYVQLIDNCGYDSLWAGDHVAFAIPILDPLLQLAQAAVVSRRLIMGTAVYLFLPVTRRTDLVEAVAPQESRHDATRDPTPKW